MPEIYLYNTLTKKKERFTPVEPGKAGLYTCGPTVYDYAHIGNLRTYIFEDVLKRTLEYNGLAVEHVMNITDVGHLTGDRDMGEDKLEKGARREGKTAWEIAREYEKAFFDDIKKLNINMPDKTPRATECIPGQIELVRILEEKGYTYKTSDGIYFDTAKFPDYNKLNHKPLDELKEGARVEKNEEKRNPTDFALWKFSPPRAKRHMEWDSPWGKGFPGWHLECSVMSRGNLGRNLDIHCGGIDHIDVHHTNEIAQSEAAYGRPFFNYWMHGAFLNITGGKKMAKSEGNFLTLQNAFIKKGIDPLVFRFAALNVHYRKPMECSEEVLKNAQSGLEHLRNQVRALDRPPAGVKAPAPDSPRKQKFLQAVNDDLNMPQALAAAQAVLKSEAADSEKLSLVLDFDRVFGLDLDRARRAETTPPEIEDRLSARLRARAEKNWAESDRLRDEIEELGYTVEDTPEGQRVFKK